VTGGDARKIVPCKKGPDDFPALCGSYGKHMIGATRMPTVLGTIALRR